MIKHENEVLKQELQELRLKNKLLTDELDSTKKDFKYVNQFYKAMSQFVEKHYGRGLFTFFLDTGIQMKAVLETLKLKFSSKKNKRP